MITQKDILTVDKDRVPLGKLVGAYAFLKDMGKALEGNKALQVPVEDATEAKTIQRRWRAYFKKEAHSRRQVQPDGKITLYLWLGK